MSGDEIPRAVAATIRQLAEWGLTWHDGRDARDDLLATAEQVATVRADDPICCPLCQEVECNEGCPLAGART